MQIGDYRVEIIPDTEFRLDGGAMFGVVPRNLWAQVCPPDDQNRIRMNMNCVFIDTGDEKVLIDTGIGDKWTSRETAMYGIERDRPLTETLKAKTGITADEISIVVNTHLHFDHAGGNTTTNGNGKVVPTFRNARYLISRAEVEHADAPSERDRASYLRDNWVPLRNSRQLEVKDGDYQVVPGLRMQTEPGHNRSMQCWRLDRGDQTVFGFADLVPMRAHLRLPWIMGYDLFPMETLEAKKRLLPKAVEENWLCVFYHDPDAPLCRLVMEGDKVTSFPIEA
ncbi:MAG TPA: MBL fold metallo-hydrolase [Pyrinomonadaceae bacterium]|nr:MBL fold metallo-hydrolase [Pyrinomonadaceae bacterium]